jgi:hypothetical protein
MNEEGRLERGVGFVPRLRCPACGAETFYVLPAAGGGEVLSCSACDCAVNTGTATALEEIKQEIGALREELNRVRRALNFLQQRMR